MWTWIFPTALISFVIGCWQAAKAVHHRVLGPQARARRRLARGTATIADRAIVTLTGTVRAPAGALTAPLSGRECVAYHATASLYDLLHHARVPVATLEEHRMTGFELEHDGTVVLVHGDRAELDQLPAPLIPRDLELERAFVVRHGHPAERARHGGFEEATIAAGDRVRVQGLAMIEADPMGERGYRDGVGQVRIVGHPAHPITIGRA